VKGQVKAPPKAVPSKKIVLLGMMTRIPVAGVVWQTLHYLVGLQRLGYEPYYVETHARTPSMLMERESDDSSAMAAAFIDGALRPFGLGDRWAFYGLHQDNRCFGMTRRELERLYDSAQLLINLHGGTEPLPELYATDRLVYLETDPVQLQVELQQDVQATLDFLEPHCAFFTFAENYGSPDCGLPVQDRFPLNPTRQPVVIDFWDRGGAGGAVGGDTFTTVGNWRQPWREVVFNGERYTWSKHYEFLKFVDLPAHSSQPFELALSSYEPEDREMLLERGWKVRHALDVSTDPNPYRDYIAGSRGEFTVAKDQNVRLRTGWFSDRSATYLAAGRPVVSQETGFSNVFPTGEGLFAFSTMDEIIGAVESINSDYDRHCRAAEEIAREYFSHEVVLGSLLERVGVERPATWARRGRQAGTEPYPPGLVLTPESRRPTVLSERTLEVVLGQPPPGAAAPLPVQPEASVVVVTFDNLAFTRMTIEALIANSRDQDVELIVVDNGSSDGTREYLRDLGEARHDVRLVMNPSNAGFARACNQGLAVARGELLVLLNNDALVPPGWLDPIRAALANRAVGLAGPVTNRIGNEAEIEVGYETWGEYLREAAERAARHAGETTEIGTVTMFCMAMRRATYERLGPLDQRFQIGLLEDDDYSLRAHEAGLATICLQDLLVHHFGEASFGGLVPTGDYGRILEANKQRFEQKWGRPWEPYERGVKPDYERMTHRIRKLVAETLPPEAVVLVVSRGDDELLRLDRRRTLHFPPSEEGGWAGHHPASSEDAVEQLEAMRAAGGEFLLLPSSGLWWLEHYSVFGEHLESNYAAVVRDPDTCVIYSLNGSDT
jgi:GT2 family glycosyltransferase